MFIMMVIDDVDDDQSVELDYITYVKSNIVRSKEIKQATTMTI